MVVVETEDPMRQSEALERMEPVLRRLAMLAKTPVGELLQDFSSAVKVRPFSPSTTSLPFTMSL